MGATSTSYTTPSTTPSMDQYQYRALFTNSQGSTNTSTATLTVYFAPSITTAPMSQTVSVPSTATFTASSIANPSATVQWQLSTNGGSSWNSIMGATSTSYTTPSTTPSMDQYQYRAMFTNIVGSTNTNGVTLTVGSPPSITAQPMSQTVSVSSTATFSAYAVGPPSPTVQWQLSTNGGSSWSNIMGATSTSYTTPSTTSSMDQYQYRATFTNFAGSTATDAVTLTVQFAPIVTMQPVPQQVLAGSTASFTAIATADPPASVVWQVSIDGGATWIPIAGASSSTLSFTAQGSQDLNQYRVRFSNSLGSTLSDSATLFVAPQLLLQPAVDMITFGNIAASENVSVVVSNIGFGSLELRNVELATKGEGGWFSVLLQDTTPLVHGNSTEIIVTCSPPLSASGTATDVLQFASNDRQLALVSIQLSCSAVPQLSSQPGIVVSGSGAGGTIGFGDTSAPSVVSVSVTNTGFGVLTVNASSTSTQRRSSTTLVERQVELVSVSGFGVGLDLSSGQYWFWISPAMVSLSHGESGSISITCSPPALSIGTMNATVIVATNDPTVNVTMLQLSCTSHGAGFASTPAPQSTIDLGETFNGQPAFASILVWNDAYGLLEVSLVTPLQSTWFLVSEGLPISGLANSDPPQTLQVACVPPMDAGVGEVVAEVLYLVSNDHSNPVVPFVVTCSALGMAPFEQPPMPRATPVPAIVPPPPAPSLSPSVPTPTPTAQPTNVVLPPSASQPSNTTLVTSVVSDANDLIILAYDHTGAQLLASITVPRSSPTASGTLVITPSDQSLVDQAATNTHGVKLQSTVLDVRYYFNGMVC